jgi:hypothetical protein
MILLYMMNTTIPLSEFLPQAVPGVKLFLHIAEDRGRKIG